MQYRLYIDTLLMKVWSWWISILNSNAIVSTSNPPYYLKVSRTMCLIYPTRLRTGRVPLWWMVFLNILNLIWVYSNTYIDSKCNLHKWGMLILNCKDHEWVWFYTAPFRDRVYISNGPYSGYYATTYCCKVFACVLYGPIILNQVLSGVCV